MNSSPKPGPARLLPRPLTCSCSSSAGTCCRASMVPLTRAGTKARQRGSPSLPGRAGARGTPGPQPYPSPRLPGSPKSTVMVTCTGCSGSHCGSPRLVPTPTGTCLKAP